MPRLIACLILSTACCLVSPAADVHPDLTTIATPVTLVGTAWEVAVVDGRQSSLRTKLTFGETAVSSDVLGRWKLERVPFAEKKGKGGAIRFEGRGVGGPDLVTISGEIAGDVIIGTIEVALPNGKTEFLSFSGGRGGSVASKGTP